MLVASGHAVDLAHPRVTDAISITNVAHQLAQINRYTGAAIRPISVAEHSLLVWEISVRELQLDVHGQLAALMHDAHEIVTGDCSSPAKAAIGETWRAFEHPWQHAFQRAFSLLTPSAVHAEAIHRADMIALATERRDLLAPNDLDWSCLDGIEPVTWRRLQACEERSWHHWRDRFADVYARLAFDRMRSLERLS